jgi:release factor glutamine methyltransferase
MALARSRESRRRITSPTEVEFLGERWLVLPEVFAPTPTRSTAAHLGLLDFRAGASFLEIGSGIGVISIAAARAGCSPVVATDVNPRAVENTSMNAARFGVADAVRCIESDLFDALGDDERFDVVYWHSNNVWAPEDVALASVHERAFVDPGYDAHRRFLREAGRFVRPSGKVLLGISSRAAWDELDDLASQAGRRLVSVAVTTELEPEGPVAYELLEVRT